MTMTIDTPRLEVFPDRESWLTARLSGIGGSDAAAILALSSFRSPYSVWAEKTGLLDKSALEESEAMLWGHILEEPVRVEWEKRHQRSGLKARATPHTIIRDAEYPFLFASPDALVTSDGVDDEGLEIKTASEWKHGDWTNEVPLDYQVQCQHYLSVTGRKRWHVAALIGGQKLVCATIERNEAFISTIRKALVDWWHDHVEKKVPPPVDGSESTSETIKRVFPPESVTEEIVTLDEGFAGSHAALVELKEQEKSIGKRIAEIENRLKATIGTASAGILPNGLGRYTFKSQHRDGYTVKASDFRVLRYSKKGE